MTRNLAAARMRLLALFLLPAILSLGGCGFYKKMQANKKNNEVQASIDLARAEEAQRYIPDVFANASKALNDSKAAVEAGNYDEALQRGDEAKGLVEQINTRLPQAKMVIQQKRASLVEIQGRITPVVDQIKAIAPEDTTLIERAQGVDDQIAKIQQAAQQVAAGEQGYDAALQTAKAFLDEATDSLHKLEMDRAGKLVDRIQASWAKAVDLDVLKYIQESKQVPEEIERAKALIQSASYRAVLTQFTALEDAINRYQERSREARARARIQQAERLIGLAEKEPGASLDKIDAAKAAVDEAVTQVQQGSYDAAYAAAENSIATVRSEVQILENEIKAEVDQLEIRIEESLKWNTSQIAADQYREALDALEKARNALSEILFTEAQEATEKGGEVIEEAINQARAVTLSIRIKEDEGNLIATEPKGSYKYLKEDYQAIQGLLSDASGQVGLASYDEAEKTLIRAEEMTSGLEGGLRKHAQAQLAEAEASHKEAEDAGAGEHATEPFGESREALDQSRGAAATSDWKGSIEFAESSRTKSQMAAQQAYKFRTEDLSPKADKELQNAREAGAASYAAEIYNHALDAYEKSRKAFQANDFKTAIEQVQVAFDEAIHARRHQIERAQETVDSAIAALAPDYDKETIAAAIVDLAEAKEKMEQNQFDASRILGQSAEEKAKAAEIKTWNLRASAAISQLKARLAEAETGRAATYAQSEYNRATATLAQGEATFAVQKFKEAYESADTGKGEAEQVFTKLTDEAQLVRGEYDNLTGQLKSFVQDDFGANLHTEATFRLGSLDAAILHNDLPQVFKLYEEGMETVHKAIVATKLHNINSQKEKLAAQTGSAEKGGLFQFSDVSAPSLRESIGKVDYDPALDRLKPDADIYREGLRTLAQVEAELGRLQDAALTKAESRVQKVRTDIDNAREIGARELAPGVFNGAVDAYEKSRDMAYLLRTKLGGAESVDFVKLGAQIRSAEDQAGQLNQTAIGRRNTVDYIRDLILWTYDMTRFLDQWYPVEQLGIQMILTAAPTSQVDSYAEFQTGISAKQLLVEAKRLHERVAVVTPPPEEASIHQIALESFAKFAETAESFQKFGLYNRYPRRLRERFLADGFASLERLHQLNDRLLTTILGEVKKYDLQDFERDLSEELTAFTNYLRREKKAD
jgi:hypothetical protein